MWQHYLPIVELLHCSKEKTSDVTVTLDGTHFKAHKVVLMTYSSYFREVIRSRLLSSCFIDISGMGVSASAFQSALDWMYTAEVTLSEENIGAVWAVAKCLGIKKLIKICKRKLRRLIECKGKSAISKLVGCECFQTLGVVVRNRPLLAAEPEKKRRSPPNGGMRASKLLKTGMYKNMSVDQLVCVLVDDDINIKSEKEVFKVAVAWLLCRCPPPLDADLVFRVMSCVRFPLMSRRELMECFTNPSSQFLWKHKDVLTMLLIAYVCSSSTNTCVALDARRNEYVQPAARSSLKNRQQDFASS